MNLNAMLKQHSDGLIERIIDAALQAAVQGCVERKQSSVITIRLTVSPCSSGVKVVPQFEVNGCPDYFAVEVDSEGMPVGVARRG